MFYSEAQKGCSLLFQMVLEALVMGGNRERRGRGGGGGKSEGRKKEQY